MYLIIPDQKLKDLYQKMADLSKKQCEIDCFKIRGTIGSCCSELYCGLSIDYAKELGITISPTNNRELPCMGESGCIVPPWLRPMCTLHICDKSLINPKFSKEYFSLREAIEIHEEKLYLNNKIKENYSDYQL